MSDLLVSRNGRLGRIRLNRPRALNSLTLEMARCFSDALDQFGMDPEICAILVDGAGERGLCAGGDIRRLYDARNGDTEHYKCFWRAEYELNARIASFPKPYVVVMDGVVMGGGVGVSAHGDRRIVTERTRLAMPETRIGFFPDVGGSWLLTRKGGAGVYMALSGATIAAGDAIHIGLADVMIESRNLPELERRLAGIRAPEDIEEILRDLARTPPPGALEQHREMLDAAMAQDRVEDILAALESQEEAFARQAAADIARNSPTALKVAQALLARARTADRLETCLTQEFRAACKMLTTHDLYEGVRAAIVEKDKNPRWAPATLDEIDDATVDDILEGTGDPGPVFRAWTADA